MTVFLDKGRGKWRFDFVKNGERHTGYCLDENGEPVTAKRGALVAEAQARGKAKIAPKLPDAKLVTLSQVVADLMPGWARETRWSQHRPHVEEMVRYFGPDRPVIAITEPVMRKFADHLADEPIRVWCGGSNRKTDDPANARFWHASDRKRGPGTIQLYLEPLRQVLTSASKMRDPVTHELVLPQMPKVPMPHRPKRKARPIPDALITEIIAAMPPHVVDAIILTLCFGFRSSEAFSLKRWQVDWVAEGVRLEAADVKDDEDTFLPGSPLAMGWLRCLDMQAEERGTDHLITYRAFRSDPDRQEPWRAIHKPRGAWDRAKRLMLAKVGKTYRWHDLRASFITQVATSTGPLAAQALARHSSYATTALYVEAADELRRAAGDRTADRPALRAISGGR